METFIIVFGYLLVAAAVMVGVLVITNDRSAEAQAGAALTALFWPITVPLSILIWLFVRLAKGVQIMLDKRKNNHL